MGKTSTREVVGKIASALEEKPKSITEISEETGVDRKAVVKYCIELTNIDNIHEAEDTGKMRKFYRKTQPAYVDPAKDISAYKHFDRVEKSKIQMLKDRAES